MFQQTGHPYRATLEALAEALEARDAYTAGHGARVAALSVEIARVLGVSAAGIEALRAGARLHDIGKMGIPDSILLKPGPLTEKERGFMQIHTQIGRRILGKVPGIEPLLAVVELHHENFDGSGYPYGLKGKGIPMPARIVRVADEFDAMITDRIYRAAIRREQVIEHIQSGGGRKFDPEVVAAFTAVVHDYGNSLCLEEPVIEVARVWAPA